MEEKENTEEINEAFHHAIQELKIRNNELDEEVRQAKKRAEEAGHEAFDKLDKAFEVAVLGTVLLGTAVAALTVINGM